ncbi:hypothetical protein [Pandoraea pneumonica]
MAGTKFPPIDAERASGYEMLADVEMAAKIATLADKGGSVVWREIVELVKMLSTAMDQLSRK